MEPFIHIFTLYFNTLYYFFLFCLFWYNIQTFIYLIYWSVEFVIDIRELHIFMSGSSSYMELNWLYITCINQFCHTSDPFEILISNKQTPNISLQRYSIIINGKFKDLYNWHEQLMMGSCIELCFFILTNVYDISGLEIGISSLVFYTSTMHYPNPGL